MVQNVLASCYNSNCGGGKESVAQVVEPGRIGRSSLRNQSTSVVTGKPEAAGKAVS